MGTKSVSQLDEVPALAGDELVEVAKKSSTVLITATTISADGDDNSLNDSGAGFIAAGFVVGMRVKVEGFTGNVANNIFVGVITVLTAGKMTLGGADGDVLLDDAAGESVTITKWESYRTTIDDLVDSVTIGVDNDTTMAADSTTVAPSQHAVRTYVGLAVTGLLEFKSNIDCSANPNYPAASKGDAYVVSVAGKIGGASGEVVDVGDFIIASADNAGGTEASVGTSWFVLEKNLQGAATAGAITASGLTMATARVLGRTTAGTGAVEELTAANLLAFLGQATAAQIQAGTADKVVTADKLHDSHAILALVDGATVNWDMATGFNAKITLGGNRTLAVSNPKAGLTYSLDVAQDGTGTRLFTWPASFDWGTTGAPTLTTTINKRDRITLICTDAATPKFDAFLSGKGFS